MNFLYPARINVDADGRCFVQFADIDEAITEGENQEEALFNAQEVLTLSLEGRLDEKMDIPLPSMLEGDNIHYVAPSARVQAALLIASTRREKMSVAELARSLQTSWPSASKLENPRHSPSIRTLEKAANALGRKLVLSFE